MQERDEPRMRLLIIADRHVCDRISADLDRELWTVLEAVPGNGSLTAVSRLRPAAIILDARDGNPSFVEFCKAIRSMSEMTTASLIAMVERDQANTVDLLESGADDCWSDAPGSREFQIRLASLRRRSQQSRSTELIRQGQIELDLGRYTLRCGSQRVQMSAIQLNVLKHLMENAGRIVSRKELLERVWRKPELDEGTVSQCILRLRKQLAAAGQTNVIRNAWGSGGYVFETDAPPIQVPWRQR